MRQPPLQGARDTIHNGNNRFGGHVTGIGVL